MIIFRTISQHTTCCNKYFELRKHVYRSFALSVHYSQNLIPVNLAYDTYENLNTINDMPPLIIMHGLFGTKHNWRSLCEIILQKVYKRKIIVVDARNHGDSPHTEEHRYEDMTEDIVNLMKKENIKRCAVLGYSVGGRCMMYMALKYPHLVEKAIIGDISPVSSSASLTKMAFVFNVMKNVTVSQELNVIDARREADLQLKQLMIKDKQFRAFLLTNFIQLSNGQYGWRINVEAINRSFITNITQFPDDALNLQYLGPVLFIGGSNSHHIKKSDTAEIKKLFPRAHISYTVSESVACVVAVDLLNSKLLFLGIGTPEILVPG